jgi:hypothetical protein
VGDAVGGEATTRQVACRIVWTQRGVARALRPGRSSQGGGGSACPGTLQGEVHHPKDKLAEAGGLR